MATEKSGSLEYNGHNGISFIVDGHEDDDVDDMSGYCHIAWKRTPQELAAELRKAADFLDAHQGDHIHVDVD